MMSDRPMARRTLAEIDLPGEMLKSDQLERRRLCCNHESAVSMESRCLASRWE